MGKFDDIINHEYIKSPVRRHMTMVERAAQFGAFKAVVGHEDALHETARLTDEKMELKINSIIGSMNEDIDIDKNGKDLMIGFNPKFLIDALRVIDEEEVDLYMVNPKAPCFIRDEEQNYIYLILPVNFTTVS